MNEWTEEKKNEKRKIRLRVHVYTWYTCAQIVFMNERRRFLYLFNSLRFQMTPGLTAALLYAQQLLWYIIVYLKHERSSSTRVRKNVRSSPKRPPKNASKNKS